MKKFKRLRCAIVWSNKLIKCLIHHKIVFSLFLTLDIIDLTLITIYVDF